MKKIITMFILAMAMAMGSVLKAQNPISSEVLFKNGSTVKGTLMELQNDTIVLQISDGTLVSYPMSEVQSISNVNDIGGKSAVGDMQIEPQRKIKRVGRDLKYVGARSYLDFADIHRLLGNDLYKDYRSAYSIAGTGAAFITASVIAAGLGVIWTFWGTTENIRTRGYYTCAFAGICLPVGCIVRCIGKARIGSVVDQYNNGLRTAATYELSPSVLGFNDMATGSGSYAVGATLNINL